MTNRLIWTACVALTVLGGATMAQAQSANDICYKKALEICGGKTMTDCFADDAKWMEAGADCEGSIQQLVEGERDAAAAEQSTVSVVGMQALAYGGILRAKPSMDSAKKASMQKGDKMQILEDTGVWMDEYKWFKVKTKRGTGYQWGGIFCVEGDAPYEGILDNCQLMDSL